MLPHNLATTDHVDCEFILLDAGSSDGVKQYVELIEDSRLRYVYRPIQQQEVHFAKLYNEAASLAKGEILVTLDADNAIGPDFCDAATEWATDHSFLWAWDGDLTSGTVGRVAFAKSKFWELGGYDERLGPAGYQDLDLINRAQAYGLRRRLLQDQDVVGYAVRNTRADKANGIGLTEAEYQRINILNSAQSRRNIKSGRLVANKDG